MDFKPPALGQEDKPFNLLQPYGNSQYRVEVKMSGPDLAKKIQEDTASIFSFYFKKAYFWGSIKGNTFTLRHRNVNTRNSMAPEVVGRIIDTGNSCYVEFKIQLPLAAKISLPLTLVLVSIFPIVFGIAAFMGKMPLLAALPTLIIPLMLPVAIWFAIKMGEQDKTRILEYFQALPGADLQELRQLF